MAQFSRFAVIVLLLLVNQAKPFAAGPPNSVATTNKISAWPFSSSSSTRISPQRLSAFRFDDTHSCSADPSNNRHSASDWWYNVQSLPKSKVLRDVRNPVLAVGVWSLIVSLLHRFCRHHAIPVVRSLADHMSIPGTAHSFLVSALGLLLVFRTNSAYQRFYVRYIHCYLLGICSHSFRLFVLVSFYLITEQEGRKIWENILSVSRNMSRLVHLYKPEVGTDRYSRILDLISAYPYLLRAHIRPGCLCSDDTNIPKRYRLKLTEHRLTSETRHEGQDERSHLPATSECVVDKRHLPWRLFLPHSLPLIAHAENRPVWVCDRIAALINSVPYGPNFTSRERLSLLGMVDKLTNAVGECERIHQTAVPLNYARHSLRSLTIWLFTLPFALVKDLGLFTAPTVAVVAWLFFGVYQIGYSIEDPFQGSLRLSILCDTIRKNVVRTTAFDDLQPNLRLVTQPVQPPPPPPPQDDKSHQKDTAAVDNILFEDIPPTLRAVEKTLADALSVQPVLQQPLLQELGI
jgi:predicted membrane chloride channel (bestrophin family)